MICLDPKNAKPIGYEKDGAKLLRHRLLSKEYEKKFVSKLFHACWESEDSASCCG